MLEMVLTKKKMQTRRLLNPVWSFYNIMHERVKETETLPQNYQPPVTKSQNGAEKILSISPGFR